VPADRPHRCRGDGRGRAGLKVISNHAVGFDNIDVAAATARGIPVGNTPGILTDATADMAFALMMAAGRAWWKPRNSCAPEVEDLGPSCC